MSLHRTTTATTARQASTTRYHVKTKTKEPGTKATYDPQDMGRTRQQDGDDPPHGDDVNMTDADYTTPRGFDGDIRQTTRARQHVNTTTTTHRTSTTSGQTPTRRQHVNTGMIKRGTKAMRA